MEFARVKDFVVTEEGFGKQTGVHRASCYCLTFKYHFKVRGTHAPVRLHALLNSN
jgi:hypothetical protein